MHSWVDYYKDKIGNTEKQELFTSKYFLFLNDAINFIQDNNIKYVYEEGCGTALVSCLLYHLGRAYETYPEFHAMDRDKGMLKLAEQNVNTIGRGKINLFHGDITNLDLGYFSNSLVITHGVLEHLSSQQLEVVLNKYHKQRVNHLHYVPTDVYSEKSFGDERLLPYQEWLDIVKPTHWVLDNSGKDLYMLTKV